MEIANDIDGQPAVFNDSDIDAPVAQPVEDGKVVAPAHDRKLVEELCQRIRDDKKHHERAFARMRRDMQVAMWGADKDWGEDKYRANIVGRHVKMKTATLYAKNPRVVARRRETMDFQVWDGSMASLQLAYQTIQMAMMAVQQAQMTPPTIDELGNPVIAQPQLPPGFEQAQAVIQDFQQGTARRQMLTKLGKTLEILFQYAMREQKPLDFKAAMKKVVRRACTTGVGYVKVGFQREYGPRPGLDAQLADAKARLDHLRRLAEEVAEGDIDPDAAERAELEHSIQALMNEPEILLREGLVFDFPPSTRVIPDKRTKSLVGFVGARHLTVEYMFTVDEVREQFGVDLSDGPYRGYTALDGSSREEACDIPDDYQAASAGAKKGGMVCVWEHYDKPSGLVYYLADGYPGFLRPPAAPDVFVEDFWPVYALTFNDVESEEELFPPSDVSLMLDMQKEHNRSRQGKREHREAARPRWVYANGTLNEEDPMILRNLRPFEAAGLNMDPQSDIQRVLQPLPVPGVDPNLYDTNEVFSDTQLVVGSQEALMGGLSKATATESAISAGATNAADASSVDDLDSFLTIVSRACGQIMLREYSAEKVQEIVGPGAVWPDGMTLTELANEVYLEVEAGSTGKPNQAVEVANLQRLLPLIMQLPNIDPTWLAKETLRRLDDRLDLTEAVIEGVPSIVAMNQQMQLAAANPADAPDAQGAEGSQNMQEPPGPSGSQPAFGSNQTDPVPATA